MLRPLTCSGLMVAVAIVAGPGRASAEDCVVHGARATLEEVQVRPAGAAPFALDLHELPVQATLRGASVELEVSGAIEFKATARKVWWTLATPSVTSDGNVSLAAGAHLVNARADGASMVADAVLHASDVLPGEAKDPDERVGPVRVACGQLTLDWATDDAEPDQAPGDGDADGNWSSRTHGNTLTLRATPSAKAASRTIRVPACGGPGCVVVQGRERRAGWLRVVTANEGVRATGWVLRADLVRLPDSLGVGRSYICTGDHRSGSTDGRSAPADLLDGQATIKPGTRIHATAGAGPWATVVAEGPYRVRYMPGATWAEVAEIPGLSGDVPAYVPLAAVTLTAPAP